MSNSTHPRILVTGAGGHLGRRVVELLLETGAQHVCAASRQPEKLAALTKRGATTVEADFDDPTTLDAAFVGVERLLIISTDSLGVPGQRQRQHKAAVDAAVKAGVSQIVYTSMANPEPGSPIPFAPDHYETEQAIEKSGIPFTILRVNWYTDNLFTWLPQALVSGQRFSSAGEGRTGYVVRDDVARAAAGALTAETTQSRRLDVSGPQALTAAQIVAIANEVFGTSIIAVPVSDEQLADGLAAAGLPAPLVELIVAMDANTREGKVDIVSDTVERLTGKPPRSLREFLIENRAAFTPAK